MIPAPNSRWFHNNTNRVAVIVRNNLDPKFVFYQYRSSVAGGSHGPVVQMHLRRFMDVFTEQVVSEAPGNHHA